MTNREFFDLVSEMRHFQRMFFKTKDSSYLRKSKELERLVDAEISRVKGLMGNGQANTPKQGELF